MPHALGNHYRLGSLKLYYLLFEFFDPLNEPRLDLVGMASERFGYYHYVGHILHGEEDHRRRIDVASVEYHYLSADEREIVRDFKALEECVLGQDVFKELFQSRNVPLAVAELVDDLVLGIFGFDLKRPIERIVRSDHAKVFI